MWIVVQLLVREKKGFQRYTLFKELQYFSSELLKLRLGRKCSKFRIYQQAQEVNIGKQDACDNLNSLQTVMQGICLRIRPQNDHVEI